MDPNAPSPRPEAMGKPPPSDNPHPLPSSHSHFPSHQSFGYSTPAPFAQPSPPNQSSGFSHQFQSGGAHRLLSQSQPLTSAPHKIARTSALHSPHQIKNQQPLLSNSTGHLHSSQQLNHLQTAKQPQQPPFSAGFKPTPQSSSVALPASSASHPAFSSSIPLLTRTSHHFQAPSITAQHQLPQSQNHQDQSTAQQNRQAQQPHQQSVFENHQFYQHQRQQPLLQNAQRQQPPLQQSQLNDVKQPPRTSAFAIARPPTHSEPFPNSKSLPFPISHHPQSASPGAQSPSAARPPNPGSSSAPPLPVLSQPSVIPSSTVGSTIPHSQPSNQLLLYDIAKLHAAQCSIIGGKVYNDKGHSICGVLNQHDKPCKRIGKCPFHGVSQPVSAENSCNGYVDASGTASTPNNEDGASPRGVGGHTLPDGSPAGGSTSSNLTSTPKAIPKKQQYKHGWSKEEHFLFLRGLQVHDRGSWKQISNVVQSRNATQVQSHAQKYFLRQKQNNKNKRSIHDLTMDSPEMQELEKRFRNGEFKNVIPSLGLSENLYEPSIADGSNARNREEGVPNFGQAMAAADQGIAAFGQTDPVGHNMISDTNLPRFGQPGGGVVPRLGPGQAMSATTLGSSVSSGVQIPQLHNANQARGNFQGNAFMQPQDLLGHAGAAASAQKKFLSPMRPRSDVPQTRDVLLSAARPAFPQEVYQSNLGQMQSSMGPMLPATHGMSPKPGHRVVDPSILQPGCDRNLEGQTDHASSQAMYAQNGFSGLYSQPCGNAGVLQQSRVGGDNQLSWPYGNETKSRRLRDVMSNGKDAITLQNSFSGIMGDGFGNVGTVGGMPNEHQVDTGFDGTTNQQSPSFPTGLFGGAEGVDVGDNANPYGVNGPSQAGGGSMAARDLNVSMNGFGAPNSLQLGGLAVRGQGGVNTFVRN